MAATTETANATVTVTLDGKSISFELDGDELSCPAMDEPYLNNASRGFIGDRVEAALKELVRERAS